MAPTRRVALKRIAVAGVGCAVAPEVFWGQDSRIAIAGRPVQIGITSVSPPTVRITISPLLGGVTQRLNPSLALVDAAAGRGIGGWREPFRVQRAGDLTVRFIPGLQPSVVIQTSRGEPVQTLTFDAGHPSIAFALGKG
ncbi:MAG: hypothetical protein ACRD1W_20055, partial [Vicinamibacterales bacterium]